MSLPIENCRRLFRFRCPQTWDRLDPTEDVNVRFCPTCCKNVYFCETEEEIRQHAGQCIAVEDSEQDDWLGDIDYPDTSAGVTTLTETEAAKILKALENEDEP